MTGFARSLGLETNGQQLRVLKDQLARLAAATVRMGVVEEGRAVQVNTQFVGAFDLWFPKDRLTSACLWPSTVRLEPGILPEPWATTPSRSTIAPSPPWRHRQWPSTCMPGLPSGCTAYRPASRSLSAGQTLHEQFGQGFARVRDFRRRFLQTLHHVQSAYPTARFDADDAGLTLSHSPPPVAPRYVAPQIS